MRRSGLLAIFSALLLCPLVSADHNERIRRTTIEVEDYGCEPCVQLGYLEEFNRHREIYERLERDRDRFERERVVLEAQLEVKVAGVRKVQAEIASQQMLLDRLNRELAPFDRLENVKGFDEIEILEREKEKRKLSKAERRRLENLKEKRREFRDRQHIANRNRRRKQYAIRIETLRHELAEFDKIPAASVLRRLLEKKRAQIVAQDARIVATLKPYLKAKRDLIFCTSHFELQRLLRERGIEYDVPYIHEH